MSTREQTDYPYLRAWGQSIGSSTAYIETVLAQAREDKAPRDVIYHRDRPEDDGRPVYLASGGRVWRRYDHWQMPPTTRAGMTACLRRYRVDPAAEADATPLWQWLDVAEVAWHGWVLRRTGDVLGRVARIPRVADPDQPQPSPVLWLPFTTDGRLIGDGYPSAGQARQAVEASVHLPSSGPGAARVRYRLSPGGGRSEDIA